MAQNFLFFLDYTATTVLPDDTHRVNVMDALTLFQLGGGVISPTPPPPKFFLLTFYKYGDRGYKNGRMKHIFSHKHKDIRI